MNANPVVLFEYRVSLVALRLCCCIGALLLGYRAELALAQPANRLREVGNPIWEVHTSREYNAHGQNFAVEQDKRGIMYFGNFAGVLEYDGTSWRTIPTQNYSKVSALYQDPAGRVFVGGNGEFGYLRPDAKGTLGYQSLSDSLTAAFGEIISIFGTEAGIYFVGKKQVYLWKGKVLREWRATDPILSAFFIHGKIYLFQKKKGLSYFDGNTSVRIPVETRLRDLLDLRAMLPLDDQSVLVVTGNQGLYKLTGQRVVPFSSTANAYLIANQVSTGLRLANSRLALATIQGGIVLLSADGSLIQIIQGEQFEDRQINSMYQGRGGILWLALNNGIAQLDLPSPMSVFDDAANIKGEVNHMLRHQGRMYIGTLNGVYYLEGFLAHPVALNASCFQLASTGSDLLAATSKGVYRISGASAQALTKDFSVSLYVLRSRPEIVFVGLESGLGVLNLRTGSYRVVAGINDQIVGVSEDEQHNVWLETLSNGLYRTDSEASEFKTYGKQEGLGTLLYNQVLTSSQGLIAWNKGGLFKYETPRDKFVHYNLFGTDSSAANYWKGEIVEDAKGNFWSTQGDEKSITLYRKVAPRQYEDISQPFQALSERTFKVIYPDVDSVVWFGGPEGAIRFDLQEANDFLHAYPALIRRITLKGDTVSFNGFDPNQIVLGSASRTRAPTRIDYDLNDISFVFSAASFNVGEELNFRYYLENYDEGWSDWTSQTQKEYTNLAPGRYEFRVKARNIYNRESEEVVYPFIIERPWYRMWWAFLLYFIVLGAILYYLVRWRLRALVRERDLLENLISERTEEISSQKEELEEQSQELASKNDQLEKIDQIVQSINSEIDFTSLFQTVLARMNIIRNMESATALIFDSESNSFRFKATYGEVELSGLESVSLTLQQAEERYLENAVEKDEGVYFKTGARFTPLGNVLDHLPMPLSMITIAINVEGRVEGFIILENNSRANAFDQRDFTMIRNLKEHLVSAFIKTRILENLEKTLTNLKVAQEELIRQERLASVGQLTRGIVDRILNPLNYINNFSESSNDLIQEIVELGTGEVVKVPEEIADDYYADLNMLKVNLVKIKEHGNSTTRIVKDMQRLLKEKSNEFFETELNTFVETKVKLALQELKNENNEIDLEVEFKLETPSARVRVLPYEMSSVFKNIISNAGYSTNEKKKQIKDYTPRLTISTQTVGSRVSLGFRDNGRGIPRKELEQIFSPFFTTKPTSKGTGLGLYMSKDIVQMHKGIIEIDSKEGEYAELIIQLPIV